VPVVGVTRAFPTTINAEPSSPTASAASLIPVVYQAIVSTQRAGLTTSPTAVIVAGVPTGTSATRTQTVPVVGVTKNSRPTTSAEPSGPTVNAANLGPRASRAAVSTRGCTPSRKDIAVHLRDVSTGASATRTLTVSRAGATNATITTDARPSSPTMNPASPTILANLADALTPSRTWTSPVTIDAPRLADSDMATCATKILTARRVTASVAGARALPDKAIATRALCARPFFCLHAWVKMDDEVHVQFRTRVV